MLWLLRERLVAERVLVVNGGVSRMRAFWAEVFALECSNTRLVCQFRILVLSF